MAYNTSALIKDANNLPAPQYYNPTTDEFEPLQGSGGAGNYQPVGSDTLIGAVQGVVTAGNRVQLPNNPCREVTIIGLSTNTGSIYIGGSNVSHSFYGAELSAKDSITLTISNTNLVWIDSAVSGEGVSYVAV